MKKIFLTVITVLSVVQFTYAQWTTSGTSIYYNSGNVGIGITTPHQKLDLNGGSITMGDLNSTGVISFRNDIAVGSAGSVGFSAIDAASNGNNDGLGLYVSDGLKILDGANTYFTLLTSTGNIGIGTTTPAQKLTVAMDGSTNGTGIAIQAVNSNGAGSQPGLAYLNPSGTKRMYSYLDVGTDTYNVANASSTNVLTITQAGNLSIGTSNSQGYMLAVAGSAIATSMTVKLQANWPDYVFKKKYRLPPLIEVKTYIDQNQHLPEMPSEQQVAKDGLNLGEMNKLLVKKVEEMTLYLIELNKQVEEQQKEIDQLKTK
jgi:hypothetical protein